MLRISEIFSNPSGPDAGKEWIEFTADSPESLGSYRLLNDSGKSMALPQVRLRESEYFILRPAFSLRNENEKLFLKRGTEIIDSADLPGRAPEGKSYDRVNGHFFPGVPTLGEPNRVEGLAALRNPYPSGPFGHPAGSGLVLAVLAGAVLAAYGMLLLHYGKAEDSHHFQ